MTINYRCKKCRSLLFTENDIQQHEPNNNEVSFGYRRRGGGGDCNSVFLKDKLVWMGLCDQNTGKIECPKCHYEIGTYTWSGNQCSCGKWISPALQIAISKVDKEKPFTFPQHH
ncbi:dual specificity protein phosphatase, putative [Entamoeba histolytica HM-1:IMSS-B]|uniref:Dual specificity protein phosphatase, putative n=6 Tax=Entamoeba histolytica TaxID=5759 RepID=C4LSB4_ENTH1|nr:dual specificity protein phosphatase, putative [Entamoeba histolytica HM-1:IMSS]EMD45276.1 dual specificity protein phosphatase, putative [Entamoeba histolytica KU27]EMH74412.1 dual specificity protein phosphatase, putative [Entamoeba histolytica HM-1:IMSS-B]EMS17373.1 dual specificity protein phosphatase [Entamoeba histolytica HM-3:IMSS]ENY63982.1 dual specificity protein phosphatase, putative [Entamoeba histolytica HM-1:IMSS-A]GAT91576.1 dual specificity protein phosphatase putative [Enta|eukprot:XP_656393.1 dual specificity protein phosphatase, putative [Entamoeba histolytica HM-1:IMSS]